MALSKCPFCGANIDIESDTCTFCGMQKSQFEIHRQDMKDYSRAFRTTQDTVVKQNRHFSSNAASLTVLTILIIGILIMILCTSMNYEIYRFIKASQINRNADTHIDQMEKELENGNYLAFYTYYYEQGIHYTDYDDPTFSRYEILSQFAVQYKFCLTYMDYYCNRPEESYTNREEQLQTVGKQYYQFLQCYNRYITDAADYGSYADFSKDKEAIAYVDAMKEELDRCIMTYLLIDEQTLADIQDMSEARIIVTLEEHMKEDQKEETDEEPK